MPAVNGVGKPCAGEPHARIDGRELETGHGSGHGGGEERPTGNRTVTAAPRLPPILVTAPAPDPPSDVLGVLFSASGDGGGDTQAAWRRDEDAWGADGGGIVTGRAVTIWVLSLSRIRSIRCWARGWRCCSSSAAARVRCSCVPVWTVGRSPCRSRGPIGARQPLTRRLSVEGLADLAAVTRAIRGC